MHSENHCIFFGVVCSGTGEGKKFVSMPHYMTQFKKLLGFNPFPGTLNLKINSGFLNELLQGLKVLRINGFRQGNKVFYGVSVFPALLENKEVFLVVPDKTKNKNTAEFVSRECLRKSLNLKDNDLVKVKLVC